MRWIGRRGRIEKMRTRNIHHQTHFEFEAKRRRRAQPVVERTLTAILENDALLG